MYKLIITILLFCTAITTQFVPVDPVYCSDYTTEGSCMGLLKTCSYCPDNNECGVYDSCTGEFYNDITHTVINCTSLIINSQTISCIVTKDSLMTLAILLATILSVISFMCATHCCMKLCDSSNNSIGEYVIPTICMIYALCGGVVIVIAAILWVASDNDVYSDNFELAGTILTFYDLALVFIYGIGLVLLLFMMGVAALLLFSFWCGQCIMELTYSWCSNCSCGRYLWKYFNSIVKYLVVKCGQITGRRVDHIDYDGDFAL